MTGWQQTKTGLTALALWFAINAAFCAPGSAAEVPPGIVTCSLLAGAARSHGLPLAFFTRLIWQESSFRPDAISPAGAEGIAQFMPGTAAEKGLRNPFERGDALVKSAAYLEDLQRMFGNLGLAAAAYNAGPGRVARWLKGDAPDLPAETNAYVLAVTGTPVDTWKARGSDLSQAASPDMAAGRNASDQSQTCLRFAMVAPRHGRIPAASGGFATSGKDWAVILVGSLRREAAVSEYQIVKAQYSKVLGGTAPSVVHKRISGSRIARYIVQIERETRASANDLCGRLLRAGGACFVLANR